MLPLKTGDSVQVSLQLQQCQLDSALASIDADKQMQLAAIAQETWDAKVSNAPRPAAALQATAWL